MLSRCLAVAFIALWQANRAASAAKTNGWSNVLLSARSVVQLLAVQVTNGYKSGQRPVHAE